MRKNYQKLGFLIIKIGQIIFLSSFTYSSRNKKTWSKITNLWKLNQIE
jgi:hypothetical protein